jgi:diguanylate cyclase (GGDEF)-like protein
MPVVSASLQLLRDGTSTEVTHEFRFRRNDGATLWVEARVRLVPAAGGQPAQFVANLRDVSVRKAAEDRVAALNAKLSEQAITDGLTGLSNRRHFDGELVQSWRRAARVNRPVSLLMIDVDRFKLYNDRYGHLEGDAALRAVASVAGTFARRDGDVVARYGGEEMAVLLPGSDAKGAADRAKLIRSGIEALALEHASNPPACVVTVSIGVATMMPGSADLAREPEALIVAADRALYQAKHSGRNRVVTAMPTSAMAAVKAD